MTPRNDAPDFAERRARLQAEADRLGTDIAALALAAVLHQPWADMVLSGAATAAQVEANVAALSVAWDDRAAAALADLAEDPDTYWQTRSALPWN